MKHWSENVIPVISNSKFDIYRLQLLENIVFVSLNWVVVVRNGFVPEIDGIRFVCELILQVRGTASYGMLGSLVLFGRQKYCFFNTLDFV